MATNVCVVKTLLTAKRKSNDIVVLFNEVLINKEK
jgi:hypothetical protein